MVINLHIKQSHTDKLGPGALNESSTPPVRPNSTSRRHKGGRWQFSTPSLQTSTLNWDDCRVPAWGRFTPPRKTPRYTSDMRFDKTQKRLGDSGGSEKNSRLVKNWIPASSSILVTYCSTIRAGCFKELAQLRMLGLYICILSGRISVNSEVGRTSKDPVVAFFKVVKVKW
jgi:hypothetical protein